MTQGSILGRAAQFALPICIGNILQQLYGTVDTLVIGNFCDASALAAVATSSQPLEILLCIFLGIGSGISILVSQACGASDQATLKKLLKAACTNRSVFSVRCQSAAYVVRRSCRTVPSQADAGACRCHALRHCVFAYHNVRHSRQYGI